MPELPEVEIMTRALRRRLTGRRITRVEVCDSKIKLSRRVTGRRIRGVRRRGKFIIFDLSGGLHLLAHLRMTGWFEFTRPARHRLALMTDRGAAYFADSRRFGQVRVVDADELRLALAGLGPEPLGRRFDLGRLRHTARAVKVALLDQRVVAGVGNIYASESLWRAKIHPRRPGRQLGADDLARLRRAVVAVLRRAIGWGDQIFEKYDQLAVYDKAGRPCRRCGAPVRRLVLAGRSTYYCPRCQPGR